MNKIVIVLFLALVASCSLKKEIEDAPPQNKDLVEGNFEFASQQFSLMLEEIGDTSLNPRNTEEDGSLRLVKSRDWTSGFFPGALWYLYDYTKDEKWQEAAERFTANVEDQQWNAKTHDMGFKMYCSYGNGLRLANDPTYQDILFQSAKTLITRFSPTVGCLRSWDHNSDKWQFPVIVDNMMNLELLFWATKTTGDSTFYDIAVAHAETTMKNHFRDDNSSYHVVNYDTLTGLVMDKHTHQGYSHESSWARGQAWGLYGYTMVYRETGDTRFLDQANKIAEYILSHPNLPNDLVPYWDFNALSIPDEPRDASAAAVISSALYELSSYSIGKKAEYLNKANTILESLSSPAYRASLGKNNYFLLMHSTGSYPHDSEIDVPIVYADYYWLEANMRKIKFDM